MTSQKDIIQQASALQNRASDPTKNIWVNASAGTGKTKVLTDRVLRLLLPNPDGSGATPPQNIICITFTKAGANEMIGRIMRILSKWSVIPDQDLANHLNALLGHDPSLKQIVMAKQLFATVVDIPGGLNITTIHAFCQSVLGRFTMESGLSPNFQVVEGAPLMAFRKGLRDNFIRDHLNKNLPESVSVAFDRLSQDKNADQVQSIFNAIIDQRYKIKNTSITPATLLQYLNLNQDDTEDSIFGLFFGTDYFPKAQIEELAEAYTRGSPTNHKQSSTLQHFCTSHTGRRTDFENYKKIFLTQKNELASDRAVSKGAKEHCPHAVDIFRAEGERILAYLEKIARLKLYQSTIDLLSIADIIIDHHDKHQKRQNILDYDDLIYLTQKLFSGPQKDWILFKLDYKIDHVLVDEAQDTSPEQWAIILSIIEEFFSGETHRNIDMVRTVFVVGDTKQSIYSFQGADIETYTHVHNHIKTLIEQSQSVFEDIPMDTSFRSVHAILSSVDSIFSGVDKRYALTQNQEKPIQHIISRIGDGGRIDIWPPYKDQAKETREPWTLPTYVVEQKTAEAALAERIAKTIKDWLANGHYCASKGRSVEPADIMILVRRRNSLFENIIRALKGLNIPVSGADRLVVSDYIAIEDLLSALAFCYLPDDDLNLACLLKSPLIGMNDDDLEDLAYGRERQSLWSVLKTKGAPEIVTWLSDLIIFSRRHGVYDVVCRILYDETPNLSMTGWQAFFARLGMDAFDPLEEFLNTTLHFEKDYPDLDIQGFILHMQKNKSEIKREMETSQNQVRIMTVHGSKGLQAPIVICPDTMTLPKTSLNAEDGFIWMNDSIPLWPSSKETHCDVIGTYKTKMADQIYREYCRLFYVAMTRAEDHLVICGAMNKNQNDVTEKSWYGLARQGLIDIEGVKEVNWDYDEAYHHDGINTGLEFSDENPPSTTINDTVSVTVDPITIPPWATTRNAPDKQEKQSKSIAPSQQFDDDMDIAYSPLSRAHTDHRFRRGNLTHSLLQYLPDISADKRLNAGLSFLKNTAKDLPQDVCKSILNEVMAILSSQDFAPYFGANSRAEVSLSGIVDGTMISGQIDRLLVTDTEIWIIDFKSNRPPPLTTDKVPEIYYRQLKSYKDLLAQIYPHHTIHTALLWTEASYMMELDVE